MKRLISTFATTLAAVDPKVDLALEMVVVFDVESQVAAADVLPHLAESFVKFQKTHVRSRIAVASLRHGCKFQVHYPLTRDAQHIKKIPNIASTSEICGTRGIWDALPESKFGLRWTDADSYADSVMIRRVVLLATDKAFAVNAGKTPVAKPPSRKQKAGEKKDDGKEAGEKEEEEEEEEEAVLKELRATVVEWDATPIFLVTPEVAHTYTDIARRLEGWVFNVEMKSIDKALDEALDSVVRLDSLGCVGASGCANTGVNHRQRRPHDTDVILDEPPKQLEVDISNIPGDADVDLAEEFPESLFTEEVYGTARAGDADNDDEDNDSKAPGKTNGPAVVKKFSNKQKKIRFFKDY